MDAEDKFAWMRDDEFARQTLAGMNPLAIERLTVIKFLQGLSLHASKIEDMNIIQAVL
jgi:hypothetical protein